MCRRLTDAFLNVSQVEIEIHRPLIQIARGQRHQTNHGEEGKTERAKKGKGSSAVRFGASWLAGRADGDGSVDGCERRTERGGRREWIVSLTRVTA